MKFLTSDALLNCRYVANELNLDASECWERLYET